MKVLGRGWQYTTYDLGNGRVLKRYNSVLVAYCVMFGNYLSYGGPKPWKIPQRHRQCKEEAAASLRLIAQGKLEPWMVGNPTLRGSLDYEQDKLEPLKNALRKGSVQDLIPLIDKFVGLNVELVRRGLADKSFKMGSNYGLDSQGRVVLMDLGELYTGEALAQQLAKHAWDTPYLYRTITDEEMRVYYLAQMDKHFRLP